MNTSLFHPLHTHATDLVRWATDPNPRVGLGYEFFDSRTGGGAAYGEVILFTARSSVGKTTFGLNVVENNQHLPTIFMSLEMAARFLVSRLSAIHTGVPTALIEEQLRATGKCNAVYQTVQDFQKFSIVDRPALSLKQMGQALDEAEQTWQERVRLVVIDFLELIGGVPSLSALDKIDRVTRSIKDFARERDVVVLLFHQVGRGEGGAGSDPLSLTSGRFGGEVSADYVTAAYRPCLRAGITDAEYEQDQWSYYCQFLKSRSGGGIAPQGALHQLNPHTLKLSYPYGYPAASMFAEDPQPVMEVV